MISCAFTECRVTLHTLGEAEDGMERQAKPGRSL